jgi:hypothetical protein
MYDASRKPTTPTELDLRNIGSLYDQPKYGAPQASMADELELLSLRNKRKPKIRVGHFSPRLVAVVRSNSVPPVSSQKTDDKVESQDEHCPALQHWMTESNKDQPWDAIAQVGRPLNASLGTKQVGKTTSFRSMEVNAGSRSGD